MVCTENMGEENMSGTGESNEESQPGRKLSFTHKIEGETNTEGSSRPSSFKIVTRKWRYRTRTSGVFSALIQFVTLLQLCLLVNCKPQFSRGCEWRSSISPTLSEVQVVRFSGCSTGRLNWYFPGQPTRELQPTFIEPRGGGGGSFTLCVKNTATPSHNERGGQKAGGSNADNSEASQDTLLMVADLRQDSRRAKLLSGEERCFQSGQDSAVKLSFTLDQTLASSESIPNQVPGDSPRLVSIDFRWQ